MNNATKFASLEYRRGEREARAEKEERREGLTFAETIEDHSRKEMIMAGLLLPN